MAHDEFVTWLTRWLKQHPVKRPPEHASAAYAAQVMARVAAEAGTPKPWAIPAWAPLLATGALVIALVAVLREPAVFQAPAQQAAIAPPAPAPIIPPVQLAADPQPTFDAGWIEETMDVLDAFDEEVETPDPVESAEALADELELLESVEAGTS